MQNKMLTKIKKFFNGMNEDKKVSDELNGSRTAITDIEKAEVKPLISSDQNTESSDKKPENNNTHSPEEIKEEVIKVLKTCYDPEIPVDVWELGLIYDIIAATNGDVLILMTLTSPSCPVAGILPREIEQKVQDHPMVNECKVELTFDPPWNMNMMSEVAKLELGFL